MNLAIIKTGGKQYLVKEGDSVKIEKIPGKAGDAVEFETLLLTDEKGSKVEVGTPTLKTKVKGKITRQATDKKMTVIKYKAKTRYKRTLGHKQQHTHVKIEKV